MISPFLRWDGTHARSFQRLLKSRIFSQIVVFNPCSLHSHEKSFCSWTCIPCSKMSASQVLAHLQISLDDAGVVSMAFAGIDGVLQTSKGAKINKLIHESSWVHVQRALLKQLSHHIIYIYIHTYICDLPHQ